MRTYPSLVPQATRESSCANFASMISLFYFMGVFRVSFCFSGNFSIILG